jgi:hypothetical protein
MSHEHVSHNDSFSFIETHLINESDSFVRLESYIYVYRDCVT